MSFELKSKRVFVAGHRGMVGSAIVRCLADVGCETLTATHAELDLKNQHAVDTWFAKNRPEVVFFGGSQSWWNSCE